MPVRREQYGQFPAHAQPGGRQREHDVALQSPKAITREARGVTYLESARRRLKRASK